MKIHSLIVDDFFDDPEEIRKTALALEYKTITSPYDGAEFPNIAHEIPATILKELHSKLAQVIGMRVNLRETIFRMTPKGYSPYMYAHTDTAIAPYSAILYLNDDYPETAGTEVVEAKHFPLTTDPRTKEEFMVFDQIKKSPDSWTPSLFCQMKFNRCFFFNATNFHRALPPEGFGATKNTSRLILITWFTLG